MNAPEDALVYTLDLPPDDRRTQHPLQIGGVEALASSVGQRYRGTPSASRIRQLYGDSAVFDFSPYAARAGLIYVDGNHEYANVRTDSQTALRCLAPGGVILWDDYHPVYGPGVMQALHELPAEVVRIQGTRLAACRGAGPHAG